jgi:uncharacterized RDD family membrane protein YckC
MRTVQIQTTQHVVIDQELAGLGNRIIAFVIDVIVIFVLALLLSLLGGLIPSDGLYTIFYYLVVSPIVLFYSLISELLMDGQTLGKKAMSIKVVRLNGRAPTPGDYLARWAFRLVDIWFSSGLVAAMLISSTSRGQRLGDIVGNTTVIKARPFERVSLSDVMKIYSLETYEPQYDGVRKFTEEEMLLAKTTVERYQKFKNNAHRDAVNQLADRMAAVLGMDSAPKNKITFVRTLIKDYIVLTR